MRDTTLPIALIALGAAWLAYELGWLPESRAIDAVILIVVGAGVMATEGLTRSSVVTGPILIFAGLAWLAVQQRLVAWHLVWPLGAILLGILLFIARLPGIPERRSAKRKSRDS